jgi:hypothetical protein
MTDSLHEYGVGHCPQRDVGLIQAYTTFRKVALVPSSQDWLSLYLDSSSVTFLFYFIYFILFYFILFKVCNCWWDHLRTTRTRLVDQLMVITLIISYITVFLDGWLRSCRVWILAGWYEGYPFVEDILSRVQISISRIIILIIDQRIINKSNRLVIEF